jgi:hypothetical protein
MSVFRGSWNSKTCRLENSFSADILFWSGGPGRAHHASRQAAETSVQSVLPNNTLVQGDNMGLYQSAPGRMGAQLSEEPERLQPRTEDFIETLGI